MLPILYHPSESEGFGTLTIAIEHIREIQEGIVRTNKVAQELGRYHNSKAVEYMSRLFSGDPSVAWCLSIAAPIITIVFIVAVVMCCCFPIFRALMLKFVILLLT